jgi:hypothetical protein
MKQIFLIGHKAEAGKDSTANFLRTKLNGHLLVIHFADYIKTIAKDYLKWNGEKDEFGRNLLQQLGTEKVKIELKKSLYWVERVCDIIEIAQDKYDYFAVPDCRFLSEIYYTLAKFPYNVTTIDVTRLNYENRLTKSQRNHISEIELDNFKFDYNIVSENGLNKLEIEVDKFVEWYKEKEKNN